MLLIPQLVLLHLGQTAEILLETIVPGGAESFERAPLAPPHVPMPADASDHEAELSRIFPLLNPVGAVCIG